MNQHEQLIIGILNEIQDTPENESCIFGIDNAGELTFYLDKKAEGEARVMLARQSNTHQSSTFTIDSNEAIQIGYVLTDTGISSNALTKFGEKWHVNRVDSQHDIILFVYDPDIVINLELLVRPFSNTNDTRLEHIEVNPIQTIIRHAMIPPKFINPDIPMRAYAFTYWTSFFPTLQ